jgi:hypothetical protein
MEKRVVRKKYVGRKDWERKDKNKNEDEDRYVDMEA